MFLRCRLARKERRCEIDTDGRKRNQLGGELSKKEHGWRLPTEATPFHLSR